jgi:hypothetical protein
MGQKNNRHGKKTTPASEGGIRHKEQECARSLAIANHGVTTAPQFGQLMSALISDLASQRLAPNIANAMVNAGGKMLKCVEMQYKYGKTLDNGKTVPLALV